MDKRNGEEFTYKFPMPAITTDILLWRDTTFSRERMVGPCDKEILLIKRKHEPWKDCWALPGGHFDILTDESIKHCAQRELQEETSLWLDLSNFVFIDYFDDINRDPRGRYVTFLFSAFYFDGVLEAQDDAVELAWFNQNKLPKMAADHDKIIERWVNWRYDGCR